MTRVEAGVGGERLRLAMETSTPTGSVALGARGRLLAETTLPVRSSRAETLLPEVEHLLAVCGRRLEEVDGIVVGSGPGSFTGVRIAASLARGLCFRRERQLYAYSGLRALAAGTGIAERVCALFDARRGEVYALALEDANVFDALVGPVVLGVQELLERLGQPGRWSFVGQGALRYREPLEAARGRVLPPHLAVPRAGSLLWLAETHPRAGRIRSPGDWEPEYLRPPVTERVRAG